MAQKIYQKATVQAAFVGGIFLLAAAIVSGIVLLKKSSDSPSVAVSSPTVIESSPTPPTQLINTESPAPSPLSQAMPKRQNIQASEINNPEHNKLKADLSAQTLRLKEKEQAIDKEAQLKKYIDDYIEKYSQIDLGDLPCGPNEREQKLKAKALLDLIESLARETKRTEILNGFVRERRPFSIRFYKDCS